MQTADAFQKRRQILAVDVFHREEVAAFEFADIVDAADVGMRNLPGDAHFRKQPLAPHGIVCKRLGQEFQRHRLSQLEIVGAINLAHASAADQPDNAIPAGQHHPRRESANRQ